MSRVEEPDSVDVTRPLVILIGWVGGRYRYVNKYAEACHALGCPTIVSTADVMLTFFDFHGGNKQKVRQLMTTAVQYMNQKGRDIPVVLYVFSNGGCFVYEALVQLLLEDKESGWERIQRNLKGLIFDSSPCYLHPESAVTSIQDAVVQPLVYAPIIWLFLSFVYLCTVLCIIVPSLNRPKVFWDRMKDADLGVPELYLYSKTDELASYKDLAQLIQYRKLTRKVLVTEKLWDDSKHVSHLRTDSDGYTKALHGFIDSVCKTSK